MLPTITQMLTMKLSILKKQLKDCQFLAAYALAAGIMTSEIR